MPHETDANPDFRDDPPANRDEGISAEALALLRDAAVPPDFLEIMEPWPPPQSEPWPDDPAAPAVPGVAARGPDLPMPPPGGGRASQPRPDIGTPADAHVRHDAEARVTLTGLRLDMRGVEHWTPRLRELEDAPLGGVVTNCYTTFWKDDDEEELEEARRRCPVCRLALLIWIDNQGTDPAINGARRWVLERAKALGGCFLLWEVPSSSAPFQRIFVSDIGGGKRGKRQTYGKLAYRDFAALHPELAQGNGRIDELIVFHHGRAVDESDVLYALWDILTQQLRLTVCRVVYWACNAAVQVDTAVGGDVDGLMRALGALAQREPCRCAGPVEFVYPTPGRCAINEPGQAMRLFTVDGRVQRLRWGYRHPDGTLRRDPVDSPGQRVARPDVREHETLTGYRILDVPLAADATLDRTD